MWPPIGTDPTSPDFKEDYFDSLYYCAARRRHQHQRADRGGHRRPAGVHGAVAGVRALAGRHAALPAPGRSDGGVVHVADSLDEHVRQLRGVRRRAPTAWADAQPRVRAGLRPPARARRAGGAASSPAAVSALAVGAAAAPRPDAVWVNAARLPALVVRLRGAGAGRGRPLWVYAMRPVVTRRCVGRGGAVRRGQRLGRARAAGGQARAALALDGLVRVVARDRARARRRLTKRVRAAAAGMRAASRRRAHPAAACERASRR